MPIYEYVCKQCGERFEKLVLKLASQPGYRAPVCPYCGSEDVERAVSPFASFGDSCARTSTRGYG